MDKILKLSEPVKGQAFNTRATVELPVGPRYHRLVFEIEVSAAATGQHVALADVLGLINVKANGTSQRQILATELDHINTLNGANYAHNVDNGAGGATATGGKHRFMLPMFFAEPWRKGWAAQESRALKTSWVDGSHLNSLQLEFDIPALNATNIAAAATISFKVWTLTDAVAGGLDANKQPIANINKYYRNFEPYTAAGDLYLTRFAKRQAYEAIHLYTPTDTISNVKVTVDSVIKRDASKAANDNSLIYYDLNEAGINANWYDVVFDMSDLVEDALFMTTSTGAPVQDFQVIPTVVGSAGPGIYVVNEVYGPLD